MKRLSAALLVAVGLASSSAAFAQSSYYPSGNGYDNGYQQGEAYYDYARVIRVDPVLDGLDPKAVWRPAERNWSAVPVTSSEPTESATGRTDL